MPERKLLILKMSPRSSRHFEFTTAWKNSIGLDGKRPRLKRAIFDVLRIQFLRFGPPSCYETPFSTPPVLMASYRRGGSEGSVLTIDTMASLLDFPPVLCQFRLDYQEAISHVMNRGDRMEPIFHDDANRHQILDTLPWARLAPKQIGRCRHGVG